MPNDSTAYPAMFRDASLELLSLVSGRPMVFGRGNEADHHLDSLNCSRRQFSVTWLDSRVVVEPLSGNVPTMHNGAPIERSVVLTHGDRIEVEGFRFVFLEHALEAGLQTLSPEEVVMGLAEPEPRLGEIGLERGGRTLIGRGPPSAIVLSHPMVSRRHALVRVTKGRTVLRDMGSQNGTFVNGERIRGERELALGDRIDIGPYMLVFTGKGLVESSRRGQLRLVGCGLTRRVKVSGSRDERTILDDVTIVIEPGELTCLIGPSGSGKTTLMNALCARVPADDGDVRLNGVNLYAHFEVLKQGIALVPQHELLHERLTVRQAVEATARLRLPPDTESGEIHRLVEESLDQVELSAQADTLVGDLSGGQRKRACLANEIVCKPDLLFLDEVTSGLDESTDREMMQLFQRLAREGITVVCVTHTLANVVESCDRVAVMARGGALAFAGSPAEATEYFKVPKLADVYRTLEERESPAWASAFRQCELFARRMTPHLGDAAPGLIAPQLEEGLGPGKRFKLLLHQLVILTARYARIMAADRKALGTAVVQAAVIGLVVALVFDVDGLDRPAAAQARFMQIFIMGICALWFGCNNAAKEIVKERALYRRERDVNLSVASYLASKLAVLLALGCVQVIVLALVVKAVGNLPTAFGSTWGLLAIGMAAGTGLGLLISASCTGEDQAAAVVPMALLPQILLGGALVPLHDEMALAAKLLVSGWWARIGLSALLEPVDTTRAWEAAAWLGVQASATLVLALVVLTSRDARGTVRWGVRVRRWVERARGQPQGR